MMPLAVNAETVIIGVLSALLVGLGSVVVALIAARTNREANAINWSEKLLKRLTEVEDKVGELETKLNTSQRALQAAVRFIDRLVTWGRTGADREMPEVPVVLHDYLDQDLWMLPKPDAD